MLWFGFGSRGGIRESSRNPQGKGTNPSELCVLFLNPSLLNLYLRFASSPASSPNSGVEILPKKTSFRRSSKSQIPEGLARSGLLSTAPRAARAQQGSGLAEAKFRMELKGQGRLGKPRRGIRTMLPFFLLLAPAVPGAERDTPTQPRAGNGHLEKPWTLLHLSPVEEKQGGDGGAGAAAGEISGCAGISCLGEGSASSPFLMGKFSG